MRNTEINVTRLSDIRAIAREEIITFTATRDRERRVFTCDVREDASRMLTRNPNRQPVFISRGHLYVIGIITCDIIRSH